MLKPFASRASRALPALAAALLTACAAGHPPMPTVDYVDLPRFMGDWYVIANIPTRIERNAYNAVENYRLDDKGRVVTTFTYNEGGPTGEFKRVTALGYVRDHSTNAEWGMQFVWPLRMDYRVVYLDEDYRHTVIGREKRDYVWIMARTPEISEEKFAKLTSLVESLGYDINKLQRVVHAER